MRNLTIMLGVILLVLYFGYPKYQDYKYEKEMRQAMKTLVPPTLSTEGLPIKVDMKNEYPHTKMTIQMLDMTSEQLSTSQLVQLTKENKKIACRNLEAFNKDPAYTKTIRAKIFKEDKNDFTITVTDKNGKTIDQSVQQISECENFSSIFSS